MNRKVSTLRLLLVSMLAPVFSPFVNTLAPVHAEPPPVAIEWAAPSSQAENVIDSLEFKGPIKSQASTSSDSKAFPVVVVLAGLVAFDKLSATLYDIYRQSRPGAVVTRKTDGTFVVKQVKDLPAGCVIYSFGNKTTECIFATRNANEDPSKVLVNLLPKGSI